MSYQKKNTQNTVQSVSQNTVQNTNKHIGHQPQRH